MSNSLILLAGGNSKRFGRDKTVLKTENGEYLVEKIIEAAKKSGLFSEIFIASNPQKYGVKSRFEIEDTIEIDDVSLDLGPIGGISACLNNSTSDIAVIWACDMPYFDTGLWDTLINDLLLSPDQKAVYAVNKGFVEPLAGAVRVEPAKVVIDEMIERKQQKILLMYDKLQVKAHEFTQSRFFKNINYPGDYKFLI